LIRIESEAFAFSSFNQLKFHGMLKFLDLNVFTLVDHFHQFHLNLIHGYYCFIPLS
jgi:hypothetical protein